MNQPSISTGERQERLFRHTKRGEWGLAILAWQRDGRHAYQFEDGHLRVFADTFGKLLKEVDVPADQANDTVVALLRLLDINDQDAARSRTATKPEKSPLAMEDQIAVFADMFPAGFQDAEWKRKVRGAGVKRRTQKQRDPVIADAAELLSAGILEKYIKDQQHGSVHAAVTSVLQGTDLVSAAQVKPIRALPASRHHAFAMAVRNLLHGEGAYADRLGAFLEELVRAGIKPSWQIATALGALYHPREQVCVSPSVFREQAKWMAPTLELSNVPSSSTYERCLAMARSVDEALRAEGLVPRDLFDVSDFMKQTLAPSARRRATELREKRVAKGKSSKAEAA